MRSWMSVPVQGTSIRAWPQGGISWHVLNGVVVQVTYRLLSARRRTCIHTVFLSSLFHQPDAGTCLQVKTSCQWYPFQQVFLQPGPLQGMPQSKWVQSLWLF